MESGPLRSIAPDTWLQQRHCSEPVRSACPVGQWAARLFFVADMDLVPLVEPTETEYYAGAPAHWRNIDSISQCFERVGCTVRSRGFDEAW